MKQIGNYTFFYKDKIAQWNMTDFYEEGKKYCCAEQYMMYHKAVLFNDLEIAEKIIKSNNPKEIQELGRQVKNFDEKIWKENRSKIIIQGNILKFTQNKELRDILLSTKETILVEASPIDCLYGIGLGIEDPNITNRGNWRGENLLGIILMHVRNVIKKIELF